jgi:two-component system NtrC family response regulator
MAQILIIDDDKDMSFTLREMVEHMNHTATVAYTLKDGLEKASADIFDIVFLDVQLPDGNGLAAIPRLQQAAVSPEIIIVTAHGDPGGAELALKGGVWDYLTKPLSLDNLRLSINRALKYRQQKKRCATPVAIDRCGIVGESPQMKSCIDKLAHAASMDAGVLITGETGTGKELFSRAIHANSDRSQGKFVPVDCAALPEHLVESILFGHAKGAFTGANEARSGLFEEADRGTLFLDEIGELPPHLQKAFLRVLQERSFRPVGMKTEVSSNFRVVAATNRDLDEMIGNRLFRKDLLYRIRTLEINLPPLRERIEDIKELVLHHTARICDRYGIGPKGFSSECFQVFQTYGWPGNVRELVNVLESAITAAGNEPTIYAKHLLPEIRIQLKSLALKNLQMKPDQSLSLDSKSDPLPKMNKFVDNAKRQYLLELMQQTNGNVRQACEISGLPKTTLYDQLKKYAIPRFQ